MRLLIVQIEETTVKYHFLDFQKIKKGMFTFLENIFVVNRDINPIISWIINVITQSKNVLPSINFFNTFIICLLQGTFKSDLYIIVRGVNKPSSTFLTWYNIIVLTNMTPPHNGLVVRRRLNVHFTADFFLDVVMTLFKRPRQKKNIKETFMFVPMRMVFRRSSTSFF